jgi:predicted metal-dependent enzyme (double-stranded beta helix superfamily)
VISTGYPPQAIDSTRLAHIAQRAAEHPGRWLGLVRYNTERRWYMRLAHDEQYEVWLLSWLPGQETGFHDHGPSAGAFAIARGCLQEQATLGGRPGAYGPPLTRGMVQTVEPGYVHNVGNDAPVPAISIHVYSPPLSTMNKFTAGADGMLRLDREESAW